MRIFIKLNKFYRYAYKMGHFPSLKEIFTTNKKIYAYYGYLGDNNFGDELVFESAKQIFKPNILIPVRKFMPISIKFFCHFFKSKFSGVVIGGGTLIGPFWDQNFFLNILSLRKQVYVHGTGVHKSIDCTSEWKNVFDGHVFGGVRGSLSKDNLSPIYPAVKITGDAAFAFFEVNHGVKSANGDKNILLNLGTHYDYEGQDLTRIELKKFIQYLIDKGYTIQFLPLHNIDTELGNQLKLEFPSIVLLGQPDNFINAVKIFQNCSFAIGERLHFAVMAILTRSAFISLNYGSKHEDMLQSIKLSHAGLQPANFSYDTLIDIFNNRSTFDWGSSDDMISFFKEFQLKEASDFILKS